MKLFERQESVVGKRYLKKAPLVCAPLVGAHCKQVQLAASSNQQILMALDQTVHVLDFGPKLTPGTLSGSIPIGAKCKNSVKRTKVKAILDMQRTYRVGATTALSVKVGGCDAKAFVTQASVALQDTSQINFTLSLLIQPIE